MGTCPIFWLIAVLDFVEAAEVTLLTMGPGDDMFSRFGHAALCVTDESSPSGRCYNYGTADFTTPVPLSWSVLRGRAEFWVSVTPMPRVLRSYERWDRSVYVQPLPLDAASFEGLRGRLATDALPDNRRYVYDHLTDNCATRVRDHIDEASGGALRRVDDPPGTLRALVEAGLGEPSLQAASGVVLGRRLDRVPSSYEAMFLPDRLRAGVEQALGVPAVQVTSRRGPVHSAPPGSGGLAAVAVGGGLGAVAGGLSAWGGRRGRVAGALLLALPGLVLWGLAALSGVPELRLNEMCLWFVPLDLVLATARPRWVRAWLALRVVGLALCVVLAGFGVLVQPHAVAVAYAGLALAGAAWGHGRVSQGG